MFWLLLHRYLFSVYIRLKIPTKAKRYIMKTVKGYVEAVVDISKVHSFSDLVNIAGPPGLVANEIKQSVSDEPEYLELLKKGYAYKKIVFAAIVLAVVVLVFAIGTHRRNNRVIEIEEKRKVTSFPDKYYSMLSDIPTTTTVQEP